jgi:hypothetical protein
MNVGSTDGPKQGAVVFWQPSRKRLVFVILTIKMFSLVLVFCALKFFPCFNFTEYENDIHWPRTGSPTLATHFATWDGAHYLLLSEVGYKKNSPSCAFYPLWPWLIKSFSWITFRNHFVAGILLANFLSLTAFLLFHYFVELYHGPQTANLAVALLLAYPGAIFFSFIYTEALFFLLIVSFFLFLFRENFLGVALTGFLLPLTKAVGIFCIFPLLLHLALKKLRPAAYLAYYGPILGYVTYFLFMYSTTGNAFEGFEAQRFYPNQPSIGHILDLVGTFRALFVPLELHNITRSAIDRFLFLLLIAALYPMCRLNRIYFIYVAFVGLVPALSSWFVSYTRNVMMCFPLFILLAIFLVRCQRPIVLWCILLLMGMCQVWFLVRYVNFIWAG